MGSCLHQHSVLHNGLNNGNKVNWDTQPSPSTPSTFTCVLLMITYPRLESNIWRLFHYLYRGCVHPLTQGLTGLSWLSHVTGLRSLRQHPCGPPSMSWPPSQLQIINGVCHESHTNERIHQSYYACRALLPQNVFLSLELIFLILFYLSTSPYYYLLYHFLLIMSACFLNLLIVTHSLLLLFIYTYKLKVLL